MLRSHPASPLRRSPSTGFPSLKPKTNNRSLDSVGSGGSESTTGGPEQQQSASPNPSNPQPEILQLPAGSNPVAIPTSYVASSAHPAPPQPADVATAPIPKMASFTSLAPTPPRMSLANSLTDGLGGHARRPSVTYSEAMSRRFEHIVLRHQQSHHLTIQSFVSALIRDATDEDHLARHPSSWAPQW